MISRLSLTVLVDNSILTDNGFRGEAGLSFLLETAGKKVLFDTGLSELFLFNAAMMGIGLDDLDDIVISHGHLDHTGGLVPLAQYLAHATPDGEQPRMPGLVAHSRCLWPKEKEGHRNGSAMSEADARLKFTVRLSDKPVWITEDLVFLGGIPRTFAFERTHAGKRLVHRPDGKIEPDELTDDSALAYRSGEGLVIMTGCSHAGICNITEYAREVCGEKRVVDIIGGLHLISPRPQRLKMTGEYLRKLELIALHACHCTSLKSKIVLAGYSPLREVGVGLKLDW